MTEALQQGPRTYRRAVGLCLLNTRDDESLPAQRVLHCTLSHAAQKSHKGSIQGESQHLCWRRRAQAVSNQPGGASALIHGSKKSGTRLNNRQTLFCKIWGISPVTSRSTDWFIRPEPWHAISVCQIENLFKNLPQSPETRLQPYCIKPLAKSTLPCTFQSSCPISTTPQELKPAWAIALRIFASCRSADPALRRPQTSAWHSNQAANQEAHQSTACAKSGTECCFSTHLLLSGYFTTSWWCNCGYLVLQQATFPMEKQKLKLRADV